MVISRGCLSFKVLFGAFTTLVFVCLLLVATLEIGASKTTTTTLTVKANLKKDKVVDLGREKLIYDPELDLNYMMSKRKVPNGPDPIHNRRAGNSKRPPGRV